MLFLFIATLSFILSEIMDWHDFECLKHQFAKTQFLMAIGLAQLIKYSFLNKGFGNLIHEIWGDLN